MLVPGTQSPPRGTVVPVAEAEAEEVRDWAEAAVARVRARVR
jgi:hypothetical protein